jgi:hypothetical protein
MTDFGRLGQCTIPRRSVEGGQDCRTSPTYLESLVQSERVPARLRPGREASPNPRSGADNFWVLSFY